MVTATPTQLARESPTAVPAIRRLRARVNRVLPRSLLGRSLLIIVTPLILLQVVSTWVFYDSHWETVTRRLAGSLTCRCPITLRKSRAYPVTDIENRVPASRAVGRVSPCKRYARCGRARGREAGYGRGRRRVNGP